MIKRVILFAIIVFLVIPTVAPGFSMEGILEKGQGMVEDACEAFFGQDLQSANVLLADKSGSAFIVCLMENGKTNLISILPAAKPKGEEEKTFLSVYKEEGIAGLEEKVAKSLSKNISGYLEVDLLGIAPVVDALGGVEMEGKTFSGEKMENYLKSQNGDATAAKAQQEAVLAVGRRFCSAGFWKGQNALRKLLKITDTDLSITTLMKIGKNLIPALEGKDLLQNCLPNANGWEIPHSRGAMIGGPEFA